MKKILSILASAVVLAMPLAVISTPASAQTSAPAAAPAAAPAPAAPAAAPAKPGAKVHAGPAVRQLAREFGVELSAVSPSGPHGRVLKEDVQVYVKAMMQKAKEAPAAAAGATPDVQLCLSGLSQQHPGVGDGAADRAGPRRHRPRRGGGRHDPGDPDLPFQLRHHQ